jgi:hypothetical protein
LTIESPARIADDAHVECRVVGHEREPIGEGDDLGQARSEVGLMAHHLGGDAVQPNIEVVEVVHALRRAHHPALPPRLVSFDHLDETDSAGAAAELIRGLESGC